MTDDDKKKNAFEFYKHLTTLNFAGITLLAILHQAQVAPIPAFRFKGLITCFLLSMLACIITLLRNTHGVAFDVLSSEHPNRQMENITKFNFHLVSTSAVLLFVMALAYLIYSTL